MSYLSSTNYLPSRKDVLEKFQALIDGNMTRDEANDWANQWIINDHPPVKDLVVWEALDALSRADLKVSSTTYLYEQEDFIAWLKEFEEACHANPEKV